MSRNLTPEPTEGHRCPHGSRCLHCRGWSPLDDIGPSFETDRNVLALPDDEFAALLGPNGRNARPQRDPAPPAPLKRPLRTPALNVWHRELARGQRTITTFDSLWAAACRESWACEAPDDGTARRYLDEAREILRDARRSAA